MKLSKDQLNSLIRECIEEKLEELGENFEGAGQPTASKQTSEVKETRSKDNSN
jgi:hypothetical protein